MKQILLFFYVALLASTLQAAPIDEKKATKIANEFMDSLKRKFPPGFTRDIIDFKQVYVVNYGYQKQSLGFVVVAGDDSLPSQILAFAMQGKINKNNKTIQGLLADYCAEIKEWQEGKVQHAADTAAIYYQRKGRFCPPLLKGIAWHQRPPYNLRIPLDADGKQSLVGCTPVSMGQIMKYYQYPDRGTGENTYTRTNKKGRTFNIAVDYDSLRIDWNTIQNKYSEKESEEALNSVSQLLYYCALSAEANFSSESTGAGIRNASIAMFKHFGYHPSIQYIYKDHISDTELQQLLYRELEAKRPVLCSGYRHSFVCDGYVNDYFHFNWGWEGRMNGFFKLSALQAGKDNFRMFNTIAVNIRPQNLQENHHKTVSLAQPGTLHQYISDAEAHTLTSLTITGKLNGKDFRLIRKMAGSTESIWENGGELRTLDLSKAEIIPDFENPYIVIDARKERRTQTVSGRMTPDQKPKTFQFETINEDEWKALCDFKGDMDYKNHAWKYVKKDNNYYLQYYTNAQIITTYLFKDCTNLTQLILPEQTQEIRQSAFHNCSSLQQMEIPAQISEIHPRAWQGCLSIKAVSAHSSNPHFTGKDGVLYSKDFTALIYYPSYKTDFTYVMPQSIIYMRSYAFDEALFLKEVKLSEQIRTIPQFAFFNCPSLQTVRLPESVTEIFSRIFFRCKNLTKVYLPSGIRKLGTDIFYQCDNLTDIYCESTTPPAITPQSFAQIVKNEPIRLWIPKGTTESYRQTPWKSFKNISEL